MSSRPTIFLLLAAHLSGALVAGSLLEALPSEDIAIVNFIRHCEKTHASGLGCSKEGHQRAQYIARCMNTNTTSAVLPITRPAKILASQNYSESHRPHDTVLPLAQALGMDIHMPCNRLDGACVADQVQKQLEPSSTLVIVWQHEDIPLLLASMKVPGADAYTTWPYECDAPSWSEPQGSYGTSRCYDLVWQVTFTRSKRDLALPFLAGTDSGRWVPRSIQTHRQGFLGSASGECLDGLAPEVRQQPIIIFM